MLNARLYYGRIPRVMLPGTPNFRYRLDLRIYNGNDRSVYYRIILAYVHGKKKISNVNRRIKRKKYLSALYIYGVTAERERTKKFFKECPEIDFKLVYEKLKKNHNSTDSKDNLLKLIENDKDLRLF